MKIRRLPAPPRPALSIATWKRGPSLWHDEEALNFLERQLESDQYDHAALTGWKSLDLLASADRRAAAFRKALIGALDSGRRISVVVGGILSREDLNSLLLEMRRVFANRSLRSHFNGGRFRFARDSASRPFHAKCWVFWKSDNVVDLIVGSFNLSTASFLRNVEAAARPPAGEGAGIVNAIKLVLAGGAIHPKDFASIEKCLAPKRPAPAIETEKRELEYLATIEKRKGPPPTESWAPRKGSVLDPRISDYFVVLRDPSRGERVGYRIPEDLLANIFGSDFLGTKETETGMIQGPKSLIVPFPLDLAKEYRSRMSALSIELATRCTPTSVGYVVRDAFREALRERLESKFSANEKTKQKMRDFLDDRGFSDFLMTQIGTQIEALRERYARHIKLSGAALAKKLAPRRSRVLRLARQAADQMIERLERERKVAFISLDELLNLSEGISRAEIEEELAER